MSKPAKITLQQNADIYDLRKTFEVGGSMVVSLPYECTPRKATLMRCIAKNGIYVYLPETVYRNNEKIRFIIEKFFSHPLFLEVI